MIQSTYLRRTRPRPRVRHNQARPWLEPLEIRNLLSEFWSSDVPKTIVWANAATGGLVSTLVVPQHVNIADLAVRLNVTHPWDADLDIYLESPGGICISLSHFHGYDANFTDTVFDDAAAVPIGAGSPPFTGSYRPDGQLSAVDGGDAFGTWQLHVDDWPFGPFLDDGTLNSWSLIVNGNQRPPTLAAIPDQSIAAGQSL